jgi:hypothetical protein
VASQHIPDSRLKIGGVEPWRTWRDEITKEFGPLLDKIQYRGDGYNREGQVFRTWGIVYVPNPYGAGKW